MKDFKGVFPALLTPFDAQGKINHSETARLVEYLLSKGVSGFYAGGSTAEAFLLSMDERKAVLETVAEAAGGRGVLIAQVGAIATGLSVELAQYAERLGYDVVSSVPPFYYKFRVEEIRQYYYDIAGSVSLPMLIYNIPAFSGVSLSLHDFSEFLCDKRFIGVKYTSGDMFLLEQLRRAYPEKLLYNGYDEVFLSGLAAGVDGAIGSTFNFMPEKFIEIAKLWNEGKIAEAQQVQHRVNTIIDALIKVGVMQGEKEVLRHMGFDFGNARAPFKPLSEDEKRFVEKSILPLL
ncbi:MAG: N-acetylneuraminate lyase [Oscillospiraceae bacterium]|jgi:N-acetylneuraminate lyase|nr:N-acetylneuraminate lyase [Oscillospiraceae bacterium]